MKKTSTDRLSIQRQSLRVLSQVRGGDFYIGNNPFITHDCVLIDRNPRNEGVASADGGACSGRELTDWRPGPGGIPRP